MQKRDKVNNVLCMQGVRVSAVDCATAPGNNMLKNNDNQILVSVYIYLKLNNVFSSLRKLYSKQVCAEFTL